MSLNLEDSAALTERGPERTVSEDAVVLLPDAHLAAVVTGMGGPGAGNIAANITRAALTRAAPALTRSARRERRRSSASALAAGRALETVLHRIHTAIGEAAQQRSLPAMMATIAAVWIVGERATIAHVGAVRVYLLRRGQLRMLTDDHTLGMLRLRQGTMNAAAFRRSPLRTRVYQALGSGPDVDVDLAEVALTAGDRLLICNQAVHGRLSLDALVTCLSEPTAHAGASQILALAREAGADEDLSAVVLRVGSGATDHALLEDIRAVLQETFLFSGLTESELTLVAPYLDHHWLAPNEVLFEAGDPGDAFYVVVDGSVRIHKGPTALTTVTMGGSFGELCLAREVERSATATATATTLVFSLTRTRFHEIVQRRPALGARIALAALDHLGDRLRDVTERLAGLQPEAGGPGDLDLTDAPTEAVPRPQSVHPLSDLTDGDPTNGDPTNGDPTDG